MHRKKRNLGFTLIELLVVIAIIGMLATILLVSLGIARAKARDAKRVADLHEIRTALELYYTNHNQYPPLQTHLTWSGLLCGNDPNCLAQSDQDWNSMVQALQSDGDYAAATPLYTWDEKLAMLLFPPAFAAVNTSIPQDPSYATYRYAYMPSAQPLNQNYRIRAFLESSASVLKGGLTGKFYWSDKDTGIDACDQTQGYYCVGPDGNFGSFDPGKPVIYLYPTHTENVAVSMSNVAVDQSIPVYGSGWNIIAHPNGKIDDPSDGKTYPYLYWEGRSGKPTIDQTKGAVVADKDIESYLSSTLHAQGLNGQETQAFVDYWAPRMHGKQYVYIYFMPQSDYNALVPLHISPTPNTLIRVYMLWKQLDRPITVTPQKFIAPKRTGFTVVEWGGDRSQIHDSNTFSLSFQP